ncbi:hypothetical protein Q4561_02050 [Alteromonas sp. 1_MG-2023]|uniref:hypothetical protein n=1 Tax=Alteromonas sp. 1_MG-2023 TaxID=3062669 RepID=UPI0026E2EBE8|nr:hypothetical protein [Alteromonas sp. 1_MG-2023]MDO6565830.1 hypothetical protein [Alteromonas sp. 1_MG-2023]
MSNSDNVSQGTIINNQPDQLATSASEVTAITNQSFKSIHELAHTIQGYILDNVHELEPQHDSVLHALLEQVKVECTEGATGL